MIGTLPPKEYTPSKRVEEAPPPDAEKALKRWLKGGATDRLQKEKFTLAIEFVGARPPRLSKEQSQQYYVCIT